MGEVSFEKGGREKKIAKKSKILYTNANHKFIQVKFVLGGELINKFHEGASVQQESVPICYTHFTWLFSLIIKNTMAYPLYFTANTIYFLKETYTAAWDGHKDHCQWNKHSSGNDP